MTARTEAPAGWSALLADAASRPGVISEAYSRFWNYSVGNQLLALWQCMLRRLSPGPINTFIRWRELGRYVKRGEKALTLCMPLRLKRREAQEEVTQETQSVERPVRTIFIYRPNWFVLSQTEGAPYVPPPLPDWSEERALSVLKIERIPFTHLDGNVQGFARERSVSVSPIAFAPHRTILHELAHVVLGHTAESAMSDDECTPRSIREVEAEGVALICSESLGLPGAEHSRGYLQHWLQDQTIPDRFARRIFKAADAILRAGRPEDPNDSEAEVCE